MTGLIKRILVKAAIILVLPIIFIGIARAGVITSGVVQVTPGSGSSGTAVMINTSKSPNEITVTETFKSLAPIDIVFTMVEGNPLNIYDINKSVVNLTGVDWHDFHLTLGIGTGDLFKMVDLISELDFTIRHTPHECNRITSNKSNCVGRPFVSAINDGAKLPIADFIPGTGSNKKVESGHQLNLSLRFRVPNGLTTFTMRQQPTTDGKARTLGPVLTPTPPPIWLILLGLMSLALVRRSS